MPCPPPPPLSWLPPPDLNTQSPRPPPPFLRVAADASPEVAFLDFRGPEVVDHIGGGTHAPGKALPAAPHWHVMPWQSIEDLLNRPTAEGSHHRLLAVRLPKGPGGDTEPPPPTFTVLELAAECTGDLKGQEEALVNAFARDSPSTRDCEADIEIRDLPGTCPSTGRSLDVALRSLTQTLSPRVATCVLPLCRKSLPHTLAAARRLQQSYHVQKALASAPPAAAAASPRRGRMQRAVAAPLPRPSPPVDVKLAAFELPRGAIQALSEGGAELLKVDCDDLVSELVVTRAHKACPPPPPPRSVSCPLPSKRAWHGALNATRDDTHFWAPRLH